MIKAFDRANYVMCTGSTSDIKGIVRSHAYTLVNVYEVYVDEELVRLFQIRNPWGFGEWTGDWNDRDPRWTPELKMELNHIGEFKYKLC